MQTVQCPINKQLQQLTATQTLNGTPLNPQNPNYTLQWTISDPTLASIGASTPGAGIQVMPTGKTGSAVITATETASGEPTISSQIQVDFTAPVPDGLQISFAGPV